MKVSIVDSFPGQELDIIIISIVRYKCFKLIDSCFFRSNVSQTVGFIQDSNQLNVAMTRARFSVIIVGDKKTLVSDSLWKNLVENFTFSPSSAHTVLSKQKVTADMPINTLVSKKIGALIGKYEVNYKCPISIFFISMIPRMNLKNAK